MEGTHLPVFRAGSRGGHPFAGTFLQAWSTPEFVIQVHLKAAGGLTLAFWNGLQGQPSSQSNFALGQVQKNSEPLALSGQPFNTAEFHHLGSLGCCTPLCMPGATMGWPGFWLWVLSPQCPGEGMWRV